ncbi:energy transducer TonB [Hahella sp. SMD15-11]|uniref:Energy transducer TonB n=1 Tax=Thermohahella caldifontis TaxID=3142973 RepID=A0AB39V1B7_9GAMM
MRYLEFDVVRAALALSVSFVFHLILLAILGPGIPTSSGYSTTIEVELASAPASEMGASSGAAGDTARDVTDTSPAWSGKTTSSRPIRRKANRQHNLDWMNDYFSGSAKSGTPAPSSDRPVSPDIESILASAPTTGTPYWQFLVRHLAQSRYFDKQYDFSRLRKERTVILELKISPNGFMEKARVRLSSGDKALDQAAIRSAYAANPFKPPPAEDAASGYIYLVRITYTPRERAK